MAKRANHSGTIYKLSGKRANPWIARVFDRYELDEESGKAKPIYRTLGYASTKSKAQQMLEEFNANPFNMDVVSLTFKDVYEMWRELKFPKISYSNIKGYEASFAAFESIHEVPFRNLDYRILQTIIDDSEKNYPTLKKMKVLLNQVYDFAMRCNYCQTNLGKLIDVYQYRDKNPNKYEHTIFTKQEIVLLWDNSDNPYVQVILMLLYNGCRISEFLNLKKENVHLNERYFDVVESKTPSGIRSVPIANEVYAFYEEWMQNSQSDYLICTLDNKHLEYRNYRDSYWKPIFISLGMNEHKAHDTRHSCATYLERARVDLFHTQRILGHSPQCITRGVYTHLDIETLVDDIDKLHNAIVSI